jgi:hypothetical protein
MAQQHPNSRALIEEFVARQRGKGKFTADEMADHLRGAGVPDAEARLAVDTWSDSQDGPLFDFIAEFGLPATPGDMTAAQLKRLLAYRRALTREMDERHERLNAGADELALVMRGLEDKESVTFGDLLAMPEHRRLAEGQLGRLRDQQETIRRIDGVEAYMSDLPGRGEQEEGR